LSVLADDLPQLAPECRKISNLALHLGQVTARDQVDFLAGAILLVG
jgi:hypothetical protein